MKQTLYRTTLYLVALSCAGVASQSSAAIFTLNDGDSSAKVDDAAVGTGSVYDWTVGGVNHLNHQWFYYRLGGAGFESPVESISAPSSIFNGTDQLVTTYANGTLSVEVTFTLADSLNPGQSAFNEEITINNLTGSPLALSFFQYSDYDLGGDSNDQSVDFSMLGPLYRKTIQKGNNVTLTETVNPSPSIGTTVNVEAALFNTTLTRLTDGNVITLDNNPSAGPGNLTYTYEWQRTLQPTGQQGSSFQLSKLQTIIPEPSSFALMSLGAATLCFLRRQQRQNTR